jgi:hypothetical protein
LKGFGKRWREINRRMADRTRVRQPLLPVLVRHVEERHERLAALLAAAEPVPLGGTFEYDGRRYRRTDSREDHRRAKILAAPTVRVIDEATGELTHVSMAEDEIEGNDMTLTFVQTKQPDAARVARRAPVALGIPISRPP